jgi:ferredoxin-NADP reductase
MKSLYSPLAIAFSASHEQLNPYHRVSGRIIYTFLVLHASFYMNFFVQAGLVKIRLSQLVPLLGLVAFTLVTILATTSLARVRRWSYRAFFVLHLTIAVSILPLLFFHAKPIRLYVSEALFLFVVDITARKVDTVTGFSRITSIPETNLVKLVIPIPPSKIQRFRKVPGQHVYLSIPPESTPMTTSLPSIHDLLFNPYTVADVSSTDITIVLRTLHGPTSTALKHLTKLSKARPGLNIEGPYGGSQTFPNFTAEFDRVLLFAGGVGATFILPIFNHITSSTPYKEPGCCKVDMIWSMRSKAEAAWIKTTGYPDVLDDDRVKIYITGAEAEVSPKSLAKPGPKDGSVEMDDLRTIERPGRVRGGHTRPNLKDIIDTTFREGSDGHVAVLVCGPAEMAQELREHVGRWVGAGRSVWWHDETFGW